MKIDKKCPAIDFFEIFLSCFNFYNWETFSCLNQKPVYYFIVFGYTAQRLNLLLQLRQWHVCQDDDTASQKTKIIIFLFSFSFFLHFSRNFFLYNIFQSDVGDRL